MDTAILLIAFSIIGIIFLLYNSSLSHFFSSKPKLYFYNKVYDVLWKYEYFSKLDKEHQIRFSEIIRKFNKRINYKGRDGVVVTEEMKIIIAAGFAKLSLGRDFGNLYVFHTILVFPHAYRVEERKVKHLGKTSIEGYISLSWEDILKSESDLHDGVNLALHEFAHVLVVEMMQSQAQFEVEYFMVRQIYFTGKKEIEAISNGKEPVFRKYAYSSPHEFFAIAVEVFFELPEKLIQNHWKTYRNLCVLFRQNPLFNEVDNVNWKSILEYPHETGNFNKIENTQSYGPFGFDYGILKVEINKTESIITIENHRVEDRVYHFPHQDMLYATSKYIPPTKYTSEEFHLVIYFFRNNDTDSISFSSDRESPVNAVVNIFRRIGLAH
jgi:hypothetical protein